MFGESTQIFMRGDMYETNRSERHSVCLLIRYRTDVSIWIIIEPLFLTLYSFERILGGALITRGQNNNQHLIALSTNHFKVANVKISFRA